MVLSGGESNSAMVINVSKVLAENRVTRKCTKRRFKTQKQAQTGATAMMKVGRPGLLTSYRWAVQVLALRPYFDKGNAFASNYTRSSVHRQARRVKTKG